MRQGAKAPPRARGRAGASPLAVGLEGCNRRSLKTKKGGVLAGAGLDRARASLRGPRRRRGADGSQASAAGRRRRPDLRHAAPHPKPQRPVWRPSSAGPEGNRGPVLWTKTRARVRGVSAWRARRVQRVDQTQLFRGHGWPSLRAAAANFGGRRRQGVPSQGCAGTPLPGHCQLLKRALGTTVTARVHAPCAPGPGRSPCSAGCHRPPAPRAMHACRLVPSRPHGLGRTKDRAAGQDVAA